MLSAGHGARGARGAQHGPLFGGCLSLACRKTQDLRLRRPRQSLPFFLFSTVVYHSTKIELAFCIDKATCFHVCVA